MKALLVLDQYTETKSCKRIVVDIEGYNCAFFTGDNESIHLYNASFDISAKNVRILKEIEIPRYLVDLATEAIRMQRQIYNQLITYFEE
jgi:hypothetical protein